MALVRNFHERQMGRRRPEMIADLKPYPEYKPTDIEWLDGLPSHWRELSLKRLARWQNSGCYGNEPQKGAEILSVATTAQIDRDGNFAVSRMPQRAFTPEEIDRYCCKPGDILVVKSSGSAANVISGKAGVVRADSPPFIFSNFLMRFVARPAHIEPEFLFLVLTCNLTRERVKRMVSTTTYPNLRVDEYCSALLPVPPPGEQTAIMRFVGWANGRLEKAIRAKRRVIALLNEQKQAIVHHAVTRGLDPSVPLKPSGVPWVGDIPKHWEIRRAKYIYREVDERSVDGVEELLSVSHLTGVTPRSQKNITMFKAASYAGHKLCRPGDLVVNTMWAWMGALGVSTYAGIVSPSYAVYRPHRSESILGTYIDGLLRSRPYISNIICRSTGLRGSRLRLYPEEFFRLPVILPPADEQERIVKAIQGETAELNGAISGLEREIDLLREYRTRLVADVVTGKLDVREAAANLPEKPEPTVAEDYSHLGNDTELVDEEIAV